MNNKNKGYELRCELVDYLVKELKFINYYGTTTPTDFNMNKEMYAMLTLHNDEFMICVRENENTNRSYDNNILDVMNEENVPNPNIITNKHIDKIDIFAILHELGHRHNDLVKEYEKDYCDEIIRLQEDLIDRSIDESEYYKQYRRIPQERDADLYACNMMKNKAFMKKLCKYINEKNI